MLESISQAGFESTAWVPGSSRLFYILNRELVLLEISSRYALSALIVG